MSQLTSHILDTSTGKPAPGIDVILSQWQDEWIEIAQSVSNADGRVTHLLPDETILVAGTYKLTFQTKPYFDHWRVDTFYPWIEIVFNINTTEHYHIPLLLSPYGYSSYRGT